MGKLGQPISVPLADSIDASTIKNVYFQSGTTPDTVDTATSTRVSHTATSSGSAHTAGSYVEILSSSSEDIQGVYIQVQTATNTAGVDSSTLIDIAIGGAGSEVNIVENFAVGYKTQLRILQFLPISIPKGSRVSFRARSAQTTKSVNLAFTFLRSIKKIPYPSRLVTMGADTATSRGVTVTAPGGNNAKGAWTEIVASTPQTFQGLIAAPQGAGSTGITSGNMLADIAIGSAGNEIVIMGDAYYLQSVNEAIDPLRPQIMLRHIPIGTRISARYQRSAPGALDLIVYGIPY